MLFFRLKNVLVLKIFSVAQSEGTSLLPKARNHEDYMRNNHGLSVLLYYLKNTEEFKSSKWRWYRAVGCWLYPCINGVIYFWALLRTGVTSVTGIIVWVTREVISDLISSKLFSYKWAWQQEGQIISLPVIEIAKIVTILACLKEKKSLKFGTKQNVVYLGVSWTWAWYLG